MFCPAFVCFKCRCRFTNRPADAQQDDVCARCLHDLRVTARVEEPREPPACDPDFVAIRDHIEHGPMAEIDLRSDAFEAAFHSKVNAQTALDENPSDHALRRYRVAERGLRRIQDENRRRSDLAHARRHGAPA